MTGVRVGETRPVRAALIGLGWWGTTVASHVGPSEKLDIVLGVDPVAANREAFAAASGASTSGSFADALAEPDLDAVIICSPHHAHLEQVVAAAQRGIHVFCEKPFTTTSADARTALEVAAEHGIQVGIGHERRFEPPVQQLLATVAAGELGVPLTFEGNFSQDKFLQLPPDNWRLSAEKAPVGPLSATGIHLMDLAISVLGRPTEVWARLATLATEFANGDTLTATVGFESGATASLTAVLATPFIGRTCVLGSEGWVEITDRSHPEASAGWDVRSTRRGHSTSSTYCPPHNAVLANLEAFADAVAGRAPYPVSPEHIALNVATFEAITRSAASGRIEPVESADAQP